MLLVSFFRCYMSLISLVTYLGIMLTFFLFFFFFFLLLTVIFGLKTMGRKDASTARTPVDQYRKQIGKQDYKKTRPMLRATRLKAEAKKTALGIKEVALVLAAILIFLLAFYAFFYLNISNEVDLDLDPDEN
uniref:Triple QxxK/R motif-containing protein n=2 Tax=Strigops habroptila TaxID=2489341 RepID=A0A672TQR2_STRHB